MSGKLGEIIMGRDIITGMLDRVRSKHYLIFDSKLNTVDLINASQHFCGPF